jgi:hypothetical protein
MLLLLLEDKENAKMNRHEYTCLAVSSVNKGGRHENVSVFTSGSVTSSDKTSTLFFNFVV